MAISQKLLNEGEHVIVTTRTHVKALFLPILVLLVTLAAAIYLGTLGDGTTGKVIDIVVWVLAAIVIVWWVVRPFLTWLTTSYTFTNRRFLARSGFIAKEGRTIPLNRISGVDFEISVVDRIFGCGTLVSPTRVNRAGSSSTTSRGWSRCSSRSPTSFTGSPSSATTMVSDPGKPLSRDDLIQSILGSTAEFTAEGIAERVEVDLDITRRIWRALGFPEYGEDEVAFTKGDVEALALLQGSVKDGVIDFDTALNLTRAVGTTMARLADWEIATLVPQLPTGGAAGDRIAAAIRLLEDVGPPFEQLLVYAWRRHLAAAASRVEASARTTRSSRPRR